MLTWYHNDRNSNCAMAAKKVKNWVFDTPLLNAFCGHGSVQFACLLLYILKNWDKRESKFRDINHYYTIVKYLAEGENMYSTPPMDCVHIFSHQQNQNKLNHLPQSKCRLHSNSTRNQTLIDKNAAIPLAMLLTERKRAEKT